MDSKNINQDLTIIVPAYNEGKFIEDTLRSIQTQTMRPFSVIVIDDFSTDDTGDRARGLGATVVRPPTNTGSKAGAQNYGLKFVTTKYVMALDADTMLAPDAVEKLIVALDDDGVVAASGFVLPRYVKTLWERGRYIEYMFAFSFYKPIQDFYGKPLISSGCFSVYQTKILLELGGFQQRTMAEDMDFTWSAYQRGYKVRFIPEAVCYPVEPYNRLFMSKQLKRWSHGFIQNVRLHGKHLVKIPFLRMMVAVSLWDAIVASLAYLLVLPMLGILVSPVYFLAYLIDIPCVAVPVLWNAWTRGETLKALASLPAFFVLRLYNSLFLVEAIISEVILKKRLIVYEKGH